MKLFLNRDPGPQPQRTYGRLLPGGNLVLQTLERPWVPAPDGSPGGHPDTSCVPLGTYALARHNTPDHPYTWALVNPALGIYHEPGDIPAGVPARFGCLLHPDNIVETLAGCVGVGLTRSTLNGEPDIADSRAAFADLKAAVPWTDGHTLVITQGPGP
jgi:hypothetical protein